MASLANSVPIAAALFIAAVSAASFFVSGPLASLAHIQWPQLVRARRLVKTQTGKVEAAIGGLRLGGTAGLRKRELRGSRWCRYCGRRGPSFLNRHSALVHGDGVPYLTHARRSCQRAIDNRLYKALLDERNQFGFFNVPSPLRTDGRSRVVTCGGCSASGVLRGGRTLYKVRLQRLVG